VASVGAYGIVSPDTPHCLYSAWDFPRSPSNTYSLWHKRLLLWRKEPPFGMRILHLAVVVEAVRMWEAFFAFHICIACFLFRIRKNPRVSPRIPESRKLLMLFDHFQVSVSIPSTTLGGMECHNSSGAQHRAYCGTNDCVTGDRQMRQERCSPERQSAYMVPQRWIAAAASVEPPSHATVRADPSRIWACICSASAMVRMVGRRWSKNGLLPRMIKDIIMREIHTPYRRDDPMFQIENSE
jgi:hypothetical protein